jgi:hypothetical protein
MEISLEFIQLLFLKPDSRLKSLRAFKGHH